MTPPVTCGSQGPRQRLSASQFLDASPVTVVRRLREVDRVVYQLAAQARAEAKDAAPLTWASYRSVPYNAILLLPPFLLFETEPWEAGYNTDNCTKRSDGTAGATQGWLRRRARSTHSEEKVVCMKRPRDTSVGADDERLVAVAR